MLAALLPAEAAAQNASTNATTQSDDAFGRQIGTERSGLYTNDYVRGFDPVDAGNSRIEGLYFDQLDRLPGRVVGSTAIRVGITAQRYAFPAPSGLIDYDMRKPGGETEATIDLRGGPNFGGVGQFEFALPVDGERFGFTGGFSERWRIEPAGTTSQSINWGLLAQWKPGPRSMLLGFGGLTVERSWEVDPILFPDGALPPKIERGEYRGQPWAEKEIRRSTEGLVAKFPIAGLRLETGLFYTWRERPLNFTDLMSGVTPDGKVASRTIVADRKSSEQSWSGEVRLVKEWQGGGLNHRVIASLRGRKKNREFGGQHRIDLGPSMIFAQDLRAEPAFAFGPKNTDEARQVQIGAIYSLIAGDRFGFDLGASKSHYEKDVDYADPLLGDTQTEDDRILWNASASYRIAPAITLFGGISRGLEEAPIAPDRAVNRSEAPPAIATKQEEAGLRLALGKSLTLLGGAFRLSKPYYNLDPALRYRSLGSVAIKGIELSLAGKVAPGVTIVAGSVLMQPRISGEAVDTGLIGAHPVGQPKRRSTVNFDWRLGEGSGPLSFDIAIDSSSSSWVNAENTLSAPGYFTMDFGVRYRFAIGDIRAVLRPKIENLFNEFSWRVSQNGGLTYSNSRNYSLQLIADL